MKRWLIILFVISLTITLYVIRDSFALFENEKEFIINSDIGKWDILVNEESINETTEFSVSNIHVSGDSNVRANYFAPGTSGYFDIVIDPGDTNLIEGLSVPIREFADINKPVILNGKVPATGKPIYCICTLI